MRPPSIIAPTHHGRAMGGNHELLYFLLATLILLAMAGFILGSLAQADFPPASMAGPWKGDSVIYVNWTVQRHLPVSITIAADASVSGTIGDAHLANGHLSVNRGPVGRALNLATDFIITGDLQDPIIAAEGISRDRVFVPFDMKNGQLVGGVATSGALFGGKASMVLTAGRMVLNSMAEPPTTNPATTQPAEQSRGAVSPLQKRNLQLWVEDFFHHNYRDITDRKTLEWGEPEFTVLGNLSIRYKFDAVIWNKDIFTMNKAFTFTPDGEFVGVRDVQPPLSQPGAQP